MRDIYCLNFALKAEEDNILMSCVIKNTVCCENLTSRSSKFQEIFRIFQGCCSAEEVSVIVYYYKWCMKSCYN